MASVLVGIAIGGFTFLTATNTPVNYGRLVPGVVALSLGAWTSRLLLRDEGGFDGSFAVGVLLGCLAAWIGETFFSFHLPNS